jgi:hypothetical protein
MRQKAGFGVLLFGLFAGLGREVIYGMKKGVSFKFFPKRKKLKLTPLSSNNWPPGGAGCRPWAAMDLYCFAGAVRH